MCTVRDLDRLLALSCKCSKDRRISGFGVRTVEGSIDGVLPKALDCVSFEIRCCSAVLRVLEALNAMYALEAFALLHSTLKEMVFAFALISNLDFRFEEAIYR